MECSEAMNMPDEIVLEANNAIINNLIPKKSKQFTNRSIKSLDNRKHREI